MSSVIQNGWDQVTNHYITTIVLTLLYYDYLLTFDRERRLIWAQCSFNQWGTILFFLNRYCGVIGHTPVFILTFARPGSAVFPHCKKLFLYHEILAVIMQIIIGLTFITRTYALYGRSRVVLIGLTSLGLAGIGVGSYMLSQAQGSKASMRPVLPEGFIGCSVGLSWSHSLFDPERSWRLAVAWSAVMVFDLVVFAMTLARTIKINKLKSPKAHAFTRVLMRDGVVYFGVISLATMSNIITFLRGSEVTRGDSTTVTNVLASVLTSRLMFNLREERERPATTTAISSTRVTTSLLHTLTNIEEVDEAEICEVPNHQGDIEMVEIVDRRKTDNPAEHRA